jgi:hypothetical protein
LSALAGNGNLGVDPLFQDAGDSDFRLTSVSPAIDAGHGSDADGETLDASGGARVVFGTVDMGAYEFSGTRGNKVYLASTPASQTVCEGTSVTFSVTGLTNSASDFRWMEIVGGTPVELASDAIYTILPDDKTLSLIIPNASGPIQLHVARLHPKPADSRADLCERRRERRAKRHELGECLHKSANSHQQCEFLRLHLGGGGDLQTGGRYHLHLETRCEDLRWFRRD